LHPRFMGAAQRFLTGTGSSLAGSGCGNVWDADPLRRSSVLWT
jgi:hypothetical protein